MLVANIASLILLVVSQSSKADIMAVLPSLTLRPKQVAGTTIYTRLEGLHNASNADAISLTELSTWRSPKGLDYKLTKASIIFNSYDSLSGFSLRLVDGFVSDAHGALKMLNGLRLKKLRYPNGYMQFLTREKIDYAVPLNKLKTYLAKSISRTPSGIVLQISPLAAFTDNIRYPGVPPAKYWELPFYRESKTDTRLEVSISAQAYKCVETRTKEACTGIDYYLKLRNLSGEYIVVQPARCFAIYNTSLPAMLNQGSVPKTNYLGRNSDSYIGQSTILSPGESIERHFDEPLPNFEALWKSKRMRWRYDDGVSRFVFELRASDSRSGIIKDDR